MGIKVVRDNLQVWLVANPNKDIVEGGVRYSRWVVESLILYLGAIIDYGSWDGAGLQPPADAVRLLARNYKIDLG